MQIVEFNILITKGRNNAVSYSQKIDIISSNTVDFQNLQICQNMKNCELLCVDTSVRKIIRALHCKHTEEVPDT